MTETTNERQPEQQLTVESERTEFNVAHYKYCFFRLFPRPHSTLVLQGL